MTYAKPWHMPRIPHEMSVGQKDRCSKGPGQSGPNPDCSRSSVRCHRGISVGDRNTMVSWMQQHRPGSMAYGLTVSKKSCLPQLRLDLGWILGVSGLLFTIDFHTPCGTISKRLVARDEMALCPMPSHTWTVCCSPRPLTPTFKESVPSLTWPLKRKTADRY